jgi:cell division protease FtsH
MPAPQAPQQPELPRQQPKKKPPSQRSVLFWWLVTLILMIWNVMTFWPKGQSKVEIPYTTFLAQVRDNNVTMVRISGDEITGSFAKGIQWPPQSQKTKPPAGGEAKQSPEVTTARSKPAGTTATGSGSPERSAPQTYGEFLVNYPKDVGDPSLLPLLESHSVEIRVKPPTVHWYTYLFTDGLPILLLIGFFVWMGHQATKSQAGIFSFSRSRARRYTSDHPEVTFSDVAGADEAKGELREEVDFLRSPQKYHELGARIPRGVLLVGNPGTGKTLLARAVAGEAGVPFFSISASEFVEMFVGVGASRVRDLFEKAKESAPAIVFIDELDAVGRRRGAGLGQTNDEREQTLNQLLVEMDGFDDRHEVIVLAATNRPDVLDPALLRPGRFDRQVVVGLPDRPAREGILRIHTRNLRLSPKVDFQLLARSTTGMSGADLANLCNEAALIAARHSHSEVAMTDFEVALDKIMLGEARPQLRDERERRIVACHESGHALVAWFTPSADPVHKVTIIPHGRALGVTAQMPEEDHYNYSRTYLLARLAVMLGGRTAEEIVCGDKTTGAENDLVEATRLARRMVARWGMGDLGPVAFRVDEEQPFLGYELSQGREYSETTAARVDHEVQRLLAERHEAANKLISSRREQLDRMVELLLQKETLDQAELFQVLGPREDGNSKAGEMAAGEASLDPQPQAL